MTGVSDDMPQAARQMKGIREQCKVEHRNSGQWVGVSFRGTRTRGRVGAQRVLAARQNEEPADRSTYTNSIPFTKWHRPHAGERSPPPPNLPSDNPLDCPFPSSTGLQPTPGCITTEWPPNCTRARVLPHGLCATPFSPLPRDSTMDANFKR